MLWINEKDLNRSDPSTLTHKIIYDILGAYLTWTTLFCPFPLVIHHSWPMSPRAEIAHQKRNVYGGRLCKEQGRNYWILGNDRARNKSIPFIALYEILS